MNDREMSIQTSAKQTNAQTQAKQPNKHMVKSAGRYSLPRKQKQFKQRRQQRHRQHRLKKTYYSTYETRENLDSFSLSRLPEIYQTEYVRQRQNSKKKFFKLAVV